MEALVIAALIIFGIIKTIKFMTKNHLFKDKKVLATSIVCIIVATASYIFNMGWIRLYLILGLIPIICPLVFLVANLYASQYTDKSLKLKLINRFFVITYLAFWVLLPDYGDFDPGYILFGLVQNSDIVGIALMVSEIAGLAHIVLFILQVVELVKIKNRTDNSEVLIPQICPKCNAAAEDGLAFCPVCGATLLVSPQQPTIPPLSSNPVLNVVKKAASSPLFLAAVIAYSLYILFSVINSTTIGARLALFLCNILDEMDLVVAHEFYEFVGVILRILSIIGLIPTILICAGLWMTYSSARNRITDTMKTSGLTMIKVISIVQLVWNCIVFALVELLLILVVVLVAVENIYDAALIIPVVVFVVLFVAAVFVLEIIYLSKIIKSINTSKNTITTGVPSDKVSSFVAVWSFISAGCLVFSLITSFISSVAAMTSLICFGTLIFKYKSAMKALMYPQQFY